MMKKILFTLAMILIVIGVHAQTKIVTGHPDLRAKITRCAASDKTVVIDFILYNEGNRDAKLDLRGGFYGSQAFDDDANAYGRGNVFVAIGSQNLNEISTQSFPAETSLKVRVQLKNVALSATELVRFDLIMYCDPYEVNKMKFYHIPITRE